MTTVEVDCVTMAGHEYVLFERSGTFQFPTGTMQDGEHPADAARRILKDWTGTSNPKLEIVDFKPNKDTIAIVMRAMLTDEPEMKTRRIARGQLPATIGRLKGTDVEEMLKTSLNYKLTRIASETK